MKFKRTVLLAAFVVTMGLLLGAGATQAATVICENDPEPCTETSSVIRIDDLEVTDSTGEPTVYTVLFPYAAAISVYSFSLVYDFENQEDASLAMEAVQEALNSNVPIPESAGEPTSTNRFFIGAKTTDKETTAGNKILLALGSESFEDGWDECTAESNCLNGVTALESDIAYTYAVFSDGSPKLFYPVGEIGTPTPDFTWRPVENATDYFLRVEDSEEKIIRTDWYEAEEVGCLSSEGDLATCNAPGEFLIDGSYNWQVLSWIPPTNGETNHKWSDPLSFTVTGRVPTTLTVEKAGEGTGTVTSHPPGINCGDTCSADFLTFAILKANPDEGFEFTDWAGCDAVDPSTKDCTVAMIDATTVKATFSDRAPQILTVELDGVGTGTVTSDPPGIDCDDDRCSAPFNTSVTLTATPDPGSELVKLSGCDHVDPIAKECTVEMTEAKTVRAIFDSPF
jgi:hypothetical protein